MPEPLHPPYNVTQPRQLQRWLDVNSQNGRLTRTRGYVLLPSFNIPSAGRTYSEIVGVYNYAATNNFSIKNYQKFTNNGSYSLCIAYANSDLTVKRYVLVKGNFDRNLSYPPMYNGEMIKKNFRLEIWDGINGANCVQSNAVQMFSTVLGNLDYRYGLDFVLGDSAVLCTSQNTTSAYNFFLFPPRPDLLSIWFENHTEQTNVVLDGSNNVITWLNRAGSGDVTQGNPALRPAFVADAVPGTKYELKFLGVQWLQGPVTFSLQHLFVLVTPNITAANAHRFFDANGGAHTLTILGNDGLLAGNFVVAFDGGIFRSSNYSNQPSNQVQLLEIDTTQCSVKSYDGLTGIQHFASATFPGATVGPSTVTIGDAVGANDGKGELLYVILGYTTVLTGTDRDKALQYMFASAVGLNNFNGPLTFAPCTVLTPNT